MDENEIKMDEIEMDEDTFEEDESDCTDICTDDSSDDSGFGKVALAGLAVAAVGGLAFKLHKNHTFSRLKKAASDAINAGKESMRNSKPIDEENNSVEVEYIPVEDSDEESNK